MLKVAVCFCSILNNVALPISSLCSCLRSWFQRQQTCPTCRMDVLRASNNNQTPAPAQAPPPAPAAPANAPAAPPANGEVQASIHEHNPYVPAAVSTM